jgi:glycosyltransferase involved in cell wall biosynthesis
MRAVDDLPGPPSTAVRYLAVGPQRHGVTRLALQIGRLSAHEYQWLQDLTRLPADPAGIPHLHVTDRLLGDSPAGAARRFAALAAQGPCTVTLHDLPQPSDGDGRFERRTAGYRDLVYEAAGVVVSSEHERDLLHRCGIRPARLAVIPLPLEAPPSPAPAPWPAGPRPAHGPREIGMLGYVYPGKGHDEALRVLPDLPPDVGLTVLGAPSPGHEHLVDELHASAAASGRRLRVSGWLPDEDLAAAARTVDVPVAWHRHISASGSIGSWLAAGRRPVVPVHPWTVELERRCPGALLLADDLGTAVLACLDDPARTWLDPGTRLGPTAPEVAARYDDLLSAWAGELA